MWSFGSDESQLGEHAWYVANSGKTTHRVGQKKSNAFGLHDMQGNVSEWMQDCWNDSYSGASSEGGAWTTDDCGQRVMRGGSWDSSASLTRAAFRSRYESPIPSNWFGFRLARALP